MNGNLVNTGKGFMMLRIFSPKNTVTCYLVFMLAFAYVFFTAQYTVANQDFDRLDNLLQSIGLMKSEEGQKNELYTFKILQAYGMVLKTNDEQTKELLLHWENYLIDVSHYSTADYTYGINRQIEAYKKAISGLSDNISTTRTKRKNEYSPSWVDDLTAHFGKEFLKKNEMAVNQSLMALLTYDEDFEKKLKDVVFLEAMLNGSYQDYLGMFLNFYKNKLNSNEKKKLELHREIAETFLAIISKTPLTSMHNTIVLKKAMDENKAQQLNDEIFKFLKNHHLSYTFVDLSVFDDFEKAMKNK